MLATRVPPRAVRQATGVVLAWFVLLTAFSGCTTNQAVHQPAPAHSSSTTTTQSGSVPYLPGEQVARNGVGSYLFGTNDTYEWLPENIETQPAIQEALRAAGFTLIRSFIPDHAADSVIEQRIATIEHVGATCLAVITNVFDAPFDKHLVHYLGQRCDLYEFGNESDTEMTIATYLTQWNTLVPQLRALNPDARFIGPATYNNKGSNNFLQAFLQGVKASGVLPDAISFHWYPCWQRTEADCLARATTYAPVAEGVHALIKAILGKDLPVGITEWNFDPGNPPPTYGDDANFITPFTITALKSMAQGGVAFACQFDAASYAGWGHLDMFDARSGQPKAQFEAIQQFIRQARSGS